MNSRSRKRVGLIGAAAVVLGVAAAWISLSVTRERIVGLKSEIAVSTAEIEATRQRNAALEREIAEVASVKAAPPVAGKVRKARQSLEEAAARKAAAAEAKRKQQVGELMGLEIYLRPKFAELGLSAAQWDDYQIMELERREQEAEARRKVWARQSSTEETEVTIHAASAASADTVKQMRALVGAAKQDELDQFQQSRRDRARMIVQDLANRLVLHDPLSVAQMERLRPVYAEQSARDATGEGEMPRERLETVESVLTPRQLPAWRVWQRCQDITSQTLEANRAEK
jgi:hypothetical protein